MISWRFPVQLFAVVTPIAAVGPAWAQSAPGGAFAPLPASGVKCEVTDAPIANKRGGVWQLLSVSVTGDRRLVMAGVDARQRPRFIAELRGGNHMVLLDSAGNALENRVPANRASAEDGVRAAALARAVRRFCSPLPPIVGADRPLPSAPHTGVLADVEFNHPKCRVLVVSQADSRLGVVRHALMAVDQPFRMFDVKGDAKSRSLAVTASVRWGAERPGETETATVTSSVDGAVLEASKWLGYAGPKGTGERFPLSKEEIAKARAIGAEVLRRCAP